MTDHKVSDLQFGNKFSIQKEGYSVFISDENRELYIRPKLNIYNIDNDGSKVEFRKRSMGRSESDALKKSVEILYNYRVTGDTLLLDEYFTIPDGRKWSADNVIININTPEGTIIKIDRAAANLFHSSQYSEYEDDSGSASWKSGYNTLVLTENGLKPLNKPSSID
jgi:hypothetical protein